jgi:hypothetical protein
MKSYPAQNTISHPGVRAGPLTVNPNIIKVFRQFGEGWAYQADPLSCIGLFGTPTNFTTLRLLPTKNGL